MTSPTVTGRAERSRPDPLLRAKLSRPQMGDHVLERERLLRPLGDNASRRLTLLVADAGFGKTTLLANYVRRLARPVVWYSLMPSDADPIVFCRYILEGFRRENPRFGREVERMLEEGRPGARLGEVLGGTLASALAGLKGPVHVLVLDDFQEVAGEPQVAALTEALLRHLPERVRVVIASRTVPPLALERLRAGGDVFELDSSQLRLTREEQGRLFSEIYGRALSEQELEGLDETTLGWPTAVHLVHESLNRSDKVGLDQVLTSFRASSLELHDYLSSEVYARLDPASRHLLEHTAPLARFDADLASALAGGSQSSAVLERLARRGLLRRFGAAAQSSFAVHDLVRRFVRQEIEAAGGPAAWRALEEGAARALLERGEIEPALRHFLLAGCTAEATRLIRDLATPLLRGGRAAALRQYLGELPAEALRDSLDLAAAHADAHQALGMWDEAEVLYERLLERARTDGARAIECRALLGLGKVLNPRGRHEQVLGMAERGLAMAADLELPIRVRLLQMKAGAHFYLGQYKAAVAVLDQVRSLLGPSGDPELMLPTVHNLAGAYAAQGRFREALEEFRAALAQVRGTASPRAPLYLSNLAFHLAELGELADARRAAEEGLVAAQRFSNRPQECTCHQALAQIAAQSGDLDGAFASLKSAEDLNAELRMEVIASDLLALRGKIFLARGQYRRAIEFVSQAIERVASRPGDPRLTEYEAMRAWCELRAGRVRAARDQLLALRVRADAGENDFQRMRVHYWLGEALLALGESGAERHLATALKLVRERGYLYFLKVQAREEPAPLLEALARGIELDVVAAALAEAGAAVEARLLELVEGRSTAVGEAAVAVLAEIGRRPAREGLTRLAKARRPLQAAIRTALRHIDDRLARGAAPAAVEKSEPGRLVLFGPPQLIAGGRALPASAWRAQRAFQMLVYLALRPRGASREELLESFWPGRQLAAGKRNFHPTLSYVRAALPDVGVAPILREGEIYRLNPAYALSCDAWDLDHALEEARGALKPKERRALLERAAGLAAAPFLEGLYADWAEEEKARVRDRVEKLLLDLGALCAREQDFDAALAAYRRAAEMDEYRESSRVAVIECLVRLGQRRAALVEYEKLRALLRAELGVDPLPETAEAVGALLAGKAGANGSAPPAPKAREPMTAPRSSPKAAESVAAQGVVRNAQVQLKGAPRGSSR